MRKAKSKQISQDQFEEKLLREWRDAWFTEQGKRDLEMLVKWIAGFSRMQSEILANQALMFFAGRVAERIGWKPNAE